MTILGIETSCDETSAAIVTEEPQTKRLTLKSNIISSSLTLHAKTGGIIPEVAAREQIKYILPVILEALKEGIGYKNFSAVPDIDAIAVTYGPGLIGSLLVGIETAKTLSYLWQKPLIPINHMHGHIYANFIDNQAKDSQEIQFPAIVLVISGGHTDLLLMKSQKDITVLGGTRDDAAGECFDKCARVLGYPYPGGPKISQFAKKGNAKTFLLPRPMIGEDTYDFSFSGLKTAFLNLTKKHFSVLRTDPTAKVGWQQIPIESKLSENDKQILYDLCASLEQAIVDVLIKKATKAVKMFNAKSLLLSGGVAANNLLTKQFLETLHREELTTSLSVPEKILCTDNGAMIAAAAYFQNTPASWKEINVNPQLYY